MRNISCQFERDVDALTRVLLLKTTGAFHHIQDRPVEEEFVLINNKFRIKY